MRCGTGLFVSDDLLRPGAIELSLVSLRRSMAGLAMAQRRPVAFAVPGGAAASTRQVLCMPVALQPTSSSSSGSDGGQTAPSGSSQDADPPLYVGALMVGAAAAGGGAASSPPPLWAPLAALAGAAAPYLLLLGLEQASQMGELLRLHAADAGSCSSEDDELEDVGSLAAWTPHLPPAGGPESATGPPPPPPAGHSSGELPTATAADSAAQQRAGAAALSQRSRLAGGVGGRPSAGGSGSGDGGQQKGASARAWEAPRQPEDGQHDGQAADLKAAVKRRQAAPPALLGGACGAMLRFADPAVEARYAAAHNRGRAGGDAIFAAVHLFAALCVAALRPAALAGCAAACAFVAALLVPLLAATLWPVR